MSIDKIRSGVGLVALGEIWKFFIMFDNVKGIIDETIMVCHLYDLTYYKIVTIAIYDMQFEDTEV
jgi:hypothetical protein